MCGIFGVVTKNENVELFRQKINKLFILSESRGKEAAGIALHFNDRIEILKQPGYAHALIKTPAYKNFLSDKKFANIKTFSAIGHSRLVTNGIQSIHKNNQPVAKEGLVGVHNGIIVNDFKIWNSISNSKQESDIDTEALFALIGVNLKRGDSISTSITKAIAQCEGTFSIAFFLEKFNALVLATNNGSLYYYFNKHLNEFIFASENKILEIFVRKFNRAEIGAIQISHLTPRRGLIVELECIKKIEFNTNASENRIIEPSPNRQDIKIIDVTNGIKSNNLQFSNPANHPIKIPEDIIEHYNLCKEEIICLRYCTKCLLPQTMPFINFDEQGICNYCREEQERTCRGHDHLLQTVSRYRSSNDEPDCIVSLSGGRDSCYALHYFKNVLKMNPVAYTYDWGMVTDLARRNQARICGKLGIEHILISADLAKKRHNIKINVEAWLKKPDLGIIPLFMAGDKQYFYYANKVQKELNVKLLIMGENPLEKTDFKTGFCKIPETTGKLAYQLKSLNKMRIAFYYLNQFLKNPAFFNSSLLDTAWAFGSYYLGSHEYLNLFDYIQWDEKEIINTLINDYNWEIAKDTNSTWRIGDGTAAFYNYIYFIVAGFTENNTFRSHEIRANLKTREEALECILEENRPRFGSIQWYCDVIGVDFEHAIRTINAMPKLYGKH